MFLELQELKVSSNDIWRPQSYPCPGLYLVDDTITYHIVYFPGVSENGTSAIGAIMVGRDAVNKYRAYEPPSAGSAIKECTAFPPGPQLTADDIVKIIAVSQKPELAKTLLNNE